MTTENTNQPSTPDIDALVAEKVATALAAKAAEEAAAAKAAEDAAAAKAAAEAAAREAENKPAPAVFEETGDPALDISLEYAAAQGLTPESPEIAAARNGDFTKLEAYFKAKTAPGWERQLALAKGAFERVVAQRTAEQKTKAEAVFSAAGGEATWKQAAAWAVTVLKPEERDEVNEALAKGGRIAVAMAKQIVADWRAKTGTRPANPTPNGAETPASGDGLSAKEFGAAVAKLAAKNLSRDVATLPEYKALVARRLAGRNAGL